MTKNNGTRVRIAGLVLTLLGILTMLIVTFTTSGNEIQQNKEDIEEIEEHNTAQDVTIGVLKEHMILQTSTNDHISEDMGEMKGMLKVLTRRHIGTIPDPDDGQ